MGQRRKWSAATKFEIALLAIKGETTLNEVYQPIVETKISTGLRVSCKLDKRRYNPETVVSNEQMKSVQIIWNEFLSDWNYEIRQGYDVKLQQSFLRGS